MNEIGRLAAAALLLSAAFAAPNAGAQSTKDVVGTYTIVSATVVQGDKKIEPFGPNPKGMLTLDASGRYVLALARPGLPKFTSNNRDTGTAEENKAVVTGSIVHFGTYAVADGAIIFRVETSTFPNWDGQEQKRSLTLSRDELKYTTASSLGGTATLVWKRAK
jgi:Lipocalin-like domain